MNNLHPGLILILTGLAVLLLPDSIRKWVSLAGSGLALAAMLMLEKGAHLSYAFSSDITMNLLKYDSLSGFFGLIFCIIALIGSVYSMSNNNRLEKCCSLIYAGSSLGVVFAGDWVSLIFFWELMAAASIYLVWAGKTKQAERASYRYLVMHLFGGNMLLAGAVVLCTGGNFEVGPLTDPGQYGYWLVLIGVAVNGAIPPLHTWVPDAYPEASSSGTVYMGSYTTKVAIYALIRLFAGTEWLVIVGALMAVLAACMALIENDLKRLLSYHIISQLGMMVAALGTGLQAGIDGAALHAAFNILYKGVLLMGAGAIVNATGRRKISELGGLGRKMPVISVCFLIASLSIAGMPFLNGFVSKGLIMQALHHGGYTASYYLVTAAGVGTWLSITLKINYFVFWGKSENDVKCDKVPLSMTVAITAGTILCIITGLFPELSYNLSPFGTSINPFTTEHILEYIGLFIGATIPFAVLIKKMAPHDMLSLDFDWFWRKPFAYIVFGLSKVIYHIFSWFQSSYDVAASGVKLVLKNPGKVMKNVTELRENDEDGEVEDERPVGEFMGIFVLLIILVFIIVMLVR